MQKVPFTNPTEAPLYCGAVLLRPGETRLVDPRDIPPEFAGAASGAGSAGKPGNSDDITQALASGKASDVIEALDELSDEQLDALAKAEAEGKNRKTVVEAIEAERIKRASEKDGGGDGDGEGQE